MAFNTVFPSINRLDVLFFSRMSLERNRPNLLKSESLVNNGISIMVLTSYGDVAENGTNYTQCSFEKKLKFFPQKNLFGKIFNQLLSIFYLFFYTVIYRPKILLLHDSLMLPIAVFMKPFFNLHVGVDYHEILWDCGYGICFSNIVKLNERYLNKFVDVAVFPSFTRMNIIQSASGCKFKNFAIIPNYPNLMIHNNIQEALRHDDNNHDLIYFGAVNEVIYESLYESLLHLVKSGFSIDLYVFGSKVDTLKSQFTSNNRICFKPNFSARELIKIVPRYLASICVYDRFHTNNRFCEPRKLYESIALGVPVIVNNLDGPLSDLLFNKYVININNFELYDLHELKFDLSTNIELLRTQMEHKMSSGTSAFIGIIKNLSINNSHTP